MKKSPYYNYKKLFSFKNWFFLKVGLVKLVSIFFYLCFSLESSLGRLNQQSIHVMSVFNLRLISSHPRVYFFIIILCLTSRHPRVYEVLEALCLVSLFPNMQIIFSSKKLNNFFWVGFFVFGLGIARCARMFFGKVSEIFQRE